MARSLEQILQEQLGGLHFTLCVKEIEIEKLREEVAQLKEKLPKEEK